MYAQIAYMLGMSNKRSRGRPRLAESVMERTIPMRITDDLLIEIDHEREARHPAAPSRSQLMRELLVEGLKVVRAART